MLELLDENKGSTETICLGSDYSLDETRVQKNPSYFLIMCPHGDVLWIYDTFNAFSLRLVCESLFVEVLI